MATRFPRRPARPGWMVVLTVALALAAALLLAVPLVLYLLQDQLIFHPQPVGEPTVARWRAAPGVEELALRASDGTPLHGWLRHPPGGRPEPGPLLIYLGGNAEEGSWVLDGLPVPAPWRLAVVNYRGYGLSRGEPGEAVMHGDALVLFDALAARPDVDPARMVLLGRSLGSGLAVKLAQRRTPAAVVLVSPYDSVRRIAQRRYPWVPVDWLLRHPFDALEWAPEATAPLLVLIGGRDRVIAPEHSRRLARAWGGPVRVHVLPHADHQSIVGHSEFERVLRGFLAAALSPPSLFRGHGGA